MGRSFVAGDGVYAAAPAYCGHLFCFEQLMARLQRADRVTCLAADDFRGEKAQVKSTSLPGAVFARKISFDAGAVETIKFRGGFLSAATAMHRAASSRPIFAKLHAADKQAQTQTCAPCAD